MTNGTGESNSAEAVSKAFLHLPPSLLDVIIPGYSALAEYLAGVAGIDISLYVSLCALGLLFWTGIRVTVVPLAEGLIRLCSSIVVINEYDELYDQVMRWVKAQPLM